VAAITFPRPDAADSVLPDALTRRPQVLETERPPVALVRDADGVFADFGLAYFGTVAFTATAATAGQEVRIHLGEKLGDDDRIDRQPPGTIRYRCLALALQAGTHAYRLGIPPLERNTGPAAIPMPAEIGEVLPFRYCQIEGAAADTVTDLVQIATHTAWDEDAAAFASSDTVLDAIWDICRHTIKATTFCGVYVDGDRERIPYEGDAYINQLSHYATDAAGAYTVARYSLEYLIRYPTWPTDWQFHIVLMAWEDYLYTGDDQLLRRFYPTLQAKTLTALARGDALIENTPDRHTPELLASLNFDHDRYIFGNSLMDLVDWPPGSFTQGGVGERDDFEMKPVNAVICAFHYRCLVLMGRIAQAIDKPADAADYEARAARVYAAYNRVFFDPARGVYRDGEGSEHAALHANMMPLAFDLVPAEHIPSVVAHIKTRGMACSVYGAQYLLDGLYRVGEADYAHSLLTATHDRGWYNMIRSGSTMTLEAWDWIYKNNLDWNHAWGAVPANTIARWILGIQPTAPGCSRVSIRPQLGPLTHLRAHSPTPLGPIHVEATDWHGPAATLRLTLPPGCHADVTLPPGFTPATAPPGQLLYTRS